MNIEISGHHVEITEGIRQAIENKFAKISKHYPNLMTLKTTITVEPHQQKFEVTTNYEGVNVTVHAADKKLYSAIASAAKKLDVSLAKRKGVLAANMNNKYIVQQSDAYQMHGYARVYDADATVLLYPKYDLHDDELACWKFENSNSLLRLATLNILDQSHMAETLASLLTPHLVLAEKPISDVMLVS